MEFEFFVQQAESSDRRAEIEEVRSIALTLRDAMARAETSEALGRIPAIGGTSHAVDEVVTPLARELGFTSQRNDLFAEYPTRLRPDWYRPVARSGILLEIERGKTVTNNMDLLDLWKCHICRQADHLMLVVPVRVQRTGSLENVYSRVVNRMQTFMRPENRVNVMSVAILGYG